MDRSVLVAVLAEDDATMLVMLETKLDIDVVVALVDVVEGISVVRIGEELLVDVISKVEVVNEAVRVDEASVPLTRELVVGSGSVVVVAVLAARVVSVLGVSVLSTLIVAVMVPAILGSAPEIPSQTV